MATPSHSSSNWMLSLKVGFISVTVLCTAVMLKLSVPVVMEFAYSEIPSVWSFINMWLRPPYLYIVINCIIITILASFKLQQQKVVVDLPPETVAAQTVPVKVTPDYTVVYDGSKNASLQVRLPEVVFGYETSLVKGPEYGVYDRLDDVMPEIETKEMVLAANPETENKMMTFSGNAVKEIGLEDEPAISRSLWTPKRNSTEYSFFSNEKPPVSVRIRHRKAVKSTSEGGRALRVSKPKRQDTLESTWKTITDGRPMPLTRHLRKSDTWETHGHHLQDPYDPKMTKSETFHGVHGGIGEVISSGAPGLGKLRREASGSWKLKKEPSLGQDELNRRVEAFINKFNEDMRLQRQESLNQYMEMINRGAH